MKMEILQNDILVITIKEINENIMDIFLLEHYQNRIKDASDFVNGIPLSIQIIKQFIDYIDNKEHTFFKFLQNKYR